MKELGEFNFVTVTQFSRQAAPPEPTVARCPQASFLVAYCWEVISKPTSLIALIDQLRNCPGALQNTVIGRADSLDNR